jgi:hypothetical protein
MFKERKHTLNTIGKLSGIGFTLIGSYYFLSFLNGSTPRIKKTKKKKKKKNKKLCNNGRQHPSVGTTTRPLS